MLTRLAPRPLRSLLAAGLVLVLVSGLAVHVTVSPALGAPSKPGECFKPGRPKRFVKQVRQAIRISRDLPIAWATSRSLAKIVCWQGTRFKTDFRKRGGANYRWLGMFAMTREEMRAIHGTWMTANRNAFRLSPRCFAGGWDVCPNRVANAAWAQQIIAGLRWIWISYGNPTAAWTHIKRTGRFNSFPRPGTWDRATRDPFHRCPVDGPISYRDSFGERRTVGGYHPHWGTDVLAPTGRAIRAPFDGFAVAHGDNWFAGRWVTVVGKRGYVRNLHLSRFGKLGWVRAGDVVGYVGATGDARGPHNHFEWRPWALPQPLHRSPFGFTRVDDAIDPYPFLNKACRGSREAMRTGAARHVEG